MTRSNRSQNRPRVSVIIPTYNRPHMLREAIQSVLHQTYRNYEIIVVNDGGVNVSKVVNMNAAGNIVYINHPKQRHMAAARNTAIRAARGKYIAYLDDDDIFLHDHLETLVSFLETTGYKVGYSDAYRAHQSKVNGTYRVVSRDVPYSFDFDYDRILIGNFIPLLCFMHEKSCLNKVGYFDESLLALEDTELWMRVSRRYRIGHVRKVTCEFRWREDQSTTTGARRQRFLNITRAIYKKHRRFAASKPLVVLAQQLNLLYLRLYHPGAQIHGVGARNMLRRIFFVTGRIGFANPNAFPSAIEHSRL